jgi:hypothetical protein
MINSFQYRLALTSVLICFTNFAFAQLTGKLQSEKELELVDFKSIKKVLEQDGLSKQVVRKKKQVKAEKKVQVEVEAARYLYPTENELWGLVSEFWLVKNAQILGWDFQKPDYGLETSVRSIMEKLGFLQRRFKILLLNTTTVVRTTLPGNSETYFLLSVPFIRSLDLSKLEISLLLLEDFLRSEAGHFRTNVITEKMKKLAGTEFTGHKPDLSLVEELMRNYDTQVNKKGFTFQQQFEITKKMDAFLKPHPELWTTYYRMLGKINMLLKTNSAYQDYPKLYPSPEMQLKWLSPEEKVL